MSIYKPPLHDTAHVYFIAKTYMARRQVQADLSLVGVYRLGGAIFQRSSEMSPG